MSDAAGEALDNARDEVVAFARRFIKEKSSNLARLYRVELSSAVERLEKVEASQLACPYCKAPCVAVEKSKRYVNGIRPRSRKDGCEFCRPAVTA